MLTRQVCLTVQNMARTLKQKPVNVFIEAAGGPHRVAREIGVSGQAVSQWDKVPMRHVFVVARLAKIPPHEIRPDIIPEPETVE